MNPEQPQSPGGTNAASPFGSPANYPQPPAATPANPFGAPQQTVSEAQAAAPEAVAQMSSPLQQEQVMVGASSADPKDQKSQNGVTTTQVQARNPNSTQNTLLLNEIRDGMAIMSDGTMRAVVTCQSINFDLMSSREREGVEFGYQSYLNSLYFPVQILIRSQRVDIGPYLDRLSKLRRDQDNMLLGVLMEDYINFIGAISEEVNIMDKSFFIVIPYYPSGDFNSAVNSSKNLFSGLFGATKQSLVHIDETAYQKAKDEMQNRVLTVMNGLAQMGVQSVRLDTKQLSELFYNFYNPDTAVREPLGNFDPTPAVAIRKGTGEAPQPHLNRESA